MGDFTPQRLSKENTPCLDENRIEDDNIEGDNSKEIELSDISDEEENQWPDDDGRANGNGNGEQFGFKKLTKNNRDRNYRENTNRRSDRRDISSRLGAKKSDNSRKKEIERYNVRKVIANRDFSISRSKSRSYSPPRQRRGSYSPRRRSISPKTRTKTSRNKSHYYSPIVSSPRHSPSLSPDRNYPRNYQQYNKSPERTRRSRSRSRHKHKTEGKRKKHRSKEHQHHKHKKSRSRSKRRSTSPSPSSPSRQIVANSSLPAQENIKIILKNDEAYAKRQKIKKREKKNKREKSLRKLEAVKEKTQKELQQTKEVFASGDNILISVCFNNNNNNNNNVSNNHINSSSKNGGEKEIGVEERTSKSKRRQASPASSISSLDSFEQQRRQRKHKRKKTRTKKDQRGASKEPKTPPLIPPQEKIAAPQATKEIKRKNDAKPVAIIDLEKSPGKEVTQSPKEVIILSDSDGEGGKKRLDKEIIIVEDITIIERGGNIIRNHSPRDHQTPKHVTPESPPPVAPPPVLKFALKSKSNILPFNLLHDQADEIEEQPQGNANINSSNNLPSLNVESKNSQKEQETVNESINNMSEAYDPFEPTKSRSSSPLTPPHPNDISDKNKVDLFNEKKAEQISSVDEHPMWMRKEYENKKSQPVTPPLPPTFMFSTGSNSKQVSSLYDGIYGNDLKTPVVASPAKPNLKSSTKDIDDDDRTPYSPSSDGYDYEPAPPSGNVKHSDIDTQSSEPSGSFSFGADDTTSKTPLKLTASTLKTFNSTMTRSTGPVGLQYVNKAELSIFENYLPPQQKSPLVKRQAGTSNSFLRSKMSRFLNNENGSPHRMNYGSTSETLKPPIIGE